MGAKFLKLIKRQLYRKSTLFIVVLSIAVLFMYLIGAVATIGLGDVTDELGRSLGLQNIAGVYSISGTALPPLYSLLETLCSHTYLWYAVPLLVVPVFVSDVRSGYCALLESKGISKTKQFYLYIGSGIVVVSVYLLIVSLCLGGAAVYAAKVFSGQAQWNIIQEQLGIAQLEWQVVDVRLLYPLFLVWFEAVFIIVAADTIAYSLKSSLPAIIVSALVPEFIYLRDALFDFHITLFTSSDLFFERMGSACLTLALAM